VHEGTELREPKLPLQILPDVLCHESESACRQLAARRVGRADRRRVCLSVPSIDFTSASAI